MDFKNETCYNSQKILLHVKKRQNLINIHILSSVNVIKRWSGRSLRSKIWIWHLSTTPNNKK